MKFKNQITPEMTYSDLTAIVLAGGVSRRMGGINKALIKIDGKSMIQRELDILDNIFNTTVLITNSFEDYAFLGKPMFRDIKPGNGSLGGLYTGLVRCFTQYGFVFACDMPFLNEGIIRYICKKHENHDVTIPRIDGFLEPLHAIYSKSCIPAIEKHLGKGDLVIADFFREVDVLEIDDEQLKSVDCNLDFRINVNTPDDLIAAQKAIRQEF